MARKAAEKRESSKRTQVKASAKKDTGKKRTAKKNIKRNVSKKAASNQEDIKKITPNGNQNAGGQRQKTGIFNL